jgi:hypothetical protein
MRVCSLRTSKLSPVPPEPPSASPSGVGARSPDVTASDGGSVGVSIGDAVGDAVGDAEAARRRSAAGVADCGVGVRVCVGGELELAGFASLRAMASWRSAPAKAGREYASGSQPPSSPIIIVSLLSFVFI